MKSRDVVEKFCEQCGWTWTILNQYRLLFESGDLRLSLLDRTAPNFFRFVQSILIEYIVLQCTRITDPAASGKFDNLSAAYVVEKLEWPDDTRSKLRQLLAGLNDFRAHIVSARSKLIAHADLVSHEGNEALGAFPEGAEQQFLDTLQEFVNIAYSHYIGGPYSLDAVTTGDADDLVRILKRGLVFDELFDKDPELYDAALRESSLADA